MSKVYWKMPGISLVVIIAVIALVFPACSSPAEKTVKVGAVYPLTGSSAAAGESARNGILLAVDIVNNEYDLDLPLAGSKGITALDNAALEVIFADSEGSPEKGGTVAGDLITNEDVVALIGCYQSAVTEKVSQAAETKEVPFLTATSTAPSLTQKGRQWFFRTTPDEDVFIRNFYEFLDDIRELKGITGIMIPGVVYEDSVWGTECAGYAERYAGVYKYMLAEKVAYSTDDKDMTAEVQQLMDSSVDVVIQASYTKDAVLLMQAYREMGFSPDAILADDAGFSDPEFIRELGNDSNYVFVRGTWSADLTESNPLVGRVNAMYREKYATDMDDTGARTFTGMLVLADAIDRAGSWNPEDIRRALLETDIAASQLIMPWDGVRFDPQTHQNTLARGIICQILDEEYITVWPWDSASVEPVWPMPGWDERIEP